MKRTLTEGQLRGRLRAALEWCNERGVSHPDFRTIEILAGRISKGLQGRARKFVHRVVVDELTKHDIENAIVILEKKLQTITRRR
ncbi:MAG: hypothetical protein DRI61_08985 [Chloroflexi bacterium]|nr:MAG: hypothetical protein DRI61_08985 [Chloroflexota bacterium]